MLASVPLTDDERAAVDDGQAAHDQLLERLADVPTPAGTTPREIGVPATAAPPVDRRRQPRQTGMKLTNQIPQKVHSPGVEGVCDAGDHTQGHAEHGGVGVPGAEVCLGVYALLVTYQLRRAPAVRGCRLQPTALGGLETCLETTAGTEAFHERGHLAADSAQSDAESFGSGFVGHAAG
jgi:hypothetical protein